ncbi:MAG TPA: alpha/beta hydrolase [Kofleriaceae bacterium]
MAAMRAAVAAAKGTMSGPEARGPFDEVMAHTPSASGVDYEEANIGGIPGVWCRPHGARPGAALLHLHGGAYVLGSAHAYRNFVGQIAARTRTAAFIPDYRLAPEHAFPAAIDDARRVYRGLAEQGARQLVIVGDSAGGGLALVLLSLAHADAVSGRGLAPSAAVAMSPWTDLTLTGASFTSRADADPLVTHEMLAKTRDLYLGGHDARDPRASPLHGDLTGLPPIQLHVGDSEVLLDDSLRYATRARAEGVDATVHIWDGMPHVFPANVGALDAADAALALVATFVDTTLGT